MALARASGHPFTSWAHIRKIQKLVLFERLYTHNIFMMTKTGACGRFKEDVSSFFLISFGKASKLLPSPYVFVGWLKDSKKNELMSNKRTRDDLFVHLGRE